MSSPHCWLCSASVPYAVICVLLFVCRCCVPCQRYASSPAFFYSLLLFLLPPLLFIPPVIYLSVVCFYSLLLYSPCHLRSLLFHGSYICYYFPAFIRPTPCYAPTCYPSAISLTYLPLVFILLSLSFPFAITICLQYVCRYRCCCHLYGICSLLYPPSVSSKFISSVCCCTSVSYTSAVMHWLSLLIYRFVTLPSSRLPSPPLLPSLCSQPRHAVAVTAVSLITACLRRRWAPHRPQPPLLWLHF